VKLLTARFVSLAQCTEKGTLIQAIQNGNADNRSAVWGCVEDCLIKFGYPLFRLDMNCPLILFKDISKVLTVGIDVTNISGKKPSVGTVAICSDPFEGSLQHWRFHSQVLPPRRQVMSILHASVLFQRSFARYIDDCIEKKKTPAPHIIVLRKGLAEVCSYTLHLVYVRLLCCIGMCMTQQQKKPMKVLNTINKSPGHI
ncbi:hypothetical protein RFI_07118, partial [Reticulomyxa filosa]